jgi:hypothetical protein
MPDQPLTREERDRIRKLARRLALPECDPASTIYDLLDSHDRADQKLADAQAESDTRLAAIHELRSINVEKGISLGLAHQWKQEREEAQADLAREREAHEQTKADAASWRRVLETMTEERDALRTQLAEAQADKARLQAERDDLLRMVVKFLAKMVAIEPRIARDVPDVMSCILTVYAAIEAGKEGGE